jgi:tRNA G18 (ribose-2'-O)-methylase SpoU
MERVPGSEIRRRAHARESRLRSCEIVNANAIIVFACLQTICQGILIRQATGAHMRIRARDHNSMRFETKEET